MEIETKNELITKKLAQIVDILIQIQEEVPVINIDPPIEYVMEEVCRYCKINIGDLQGKSRKRNLVYARMIFARVLVSIYEIKKNDKKFKIRHKIAKELNCSAAMSNKYLLDDKMWLVNKNGQSDVKYLSTMICWKYINKLESEEALKKFRVTRKDSDI